jgi:hypothetical protein
MSTMKPARTSVRKTAAVSAASLVAASGLAFTAVMARAPEAQASTSGGTTTGTVTVGSTITLSALSPTFALSGLPGATPSTTVTMTVTTNNFAGYTVTVQPEAATLTPTIVGSTDSIPFTSIQVRETGTTTYHPLIIGTPVEVYRQTTASAQAGDPLSNDYTLTIPFVRADAYTGKIDYVATTL